MTEEFSFPALPPVRRSFPAWLGSWYRLRGRATRRQFWLLALALFGGTFVVAALAGLQEASRPPQSLESIEYVVFGALLIAGEVALFCTAVRRMHDIGRSGFWLLIWLIPFLIGLIWLLALLCTSSQQADNKYGPPH